MAPVSGPRYGDWDELTGEGIVNIISYWPAGQRTRWYDARICLGETQTNTLNRFDLCYSFKMLCQAEYGGTHQLHIAAKNYTRNYSYTAGIHQNQRITYERALRNLTVLMFLILCTSWRIPGPWRATGLSLRMSASRWRPLSAGTIVGNAGSISRRSPVRMPTGTKYQRSARMISSTSTVWCSLSWVMLKNPAFAHPKLLGCCYDNVYFNGRLTGDIPARGKPQTEEQSMKVYTQEYQEVVAWIENSIDLTEESPSYSVITYFPCQPGHNTSSQFVLGVPRTPGNPTW